MDRLCETGGFIPGMEYPDLRLQERSTGRRFWVECKFRSHAGPSWEIEWCSEEQLARYKRTARYTREPVLMIIGLGGTARLPERIYCLNLDEVNYTTLYYGTYKDHRIYGKVDSLDELLSLAGRPG